MQNNNEQAKALEAKEWLKQKGLKNPPIDSGIGGGDFKRTYVSDAMEKYIAYKMPYLSKAHQWVEELQQSRIPEQCIFTPSITTSSATKCANCGLEKWQHLKQFLNNEIVERRDYSASEAFELVLEEMEKQQSQTKS